jgi:hypothetical protein
MRLMLFVCLTSMLMSRAAAPPVKGTWEAVKDGRRAATVTVRETDGILGGMVVLYILRGNGDGALDGSASAPLAMNGTTWDGKVLRFTVNVQGAARTAFELTVTSADRGSLRAGSEVLPVTRRWER